MAAFLGLAQSSLLKNVLAVFILKNRMKISRKNLEKKIDEAKQICKCENASPGVSLLLLKQYPQCLWSQISEEELSQYKSFVYIKCSLSMSNCDNHVPIIIPHMICHS
ncbi:unnamed protein product [Moneuplotes crassus]|uniref:Uncharacterized protein n=1 Tax=Euplotes crassus TaxID=5936 RepID=A0AAD2CY74_EUPCR|nr:unnamed protein product [Moneuplotes crassus]